MREIKDFTKCPTPHRLQQGEQYLHGSLESPSKEKQFVLEKIKNKL